ncbi:glycosyltransferase family 2 protein [Dysgonomonas sp. 216]|uniref:glycosyltransferase n=1 Tax=Dysgonomonas sp. 216 TaxID=2302934 RepID=UPI0013D0A093|nr:glycosyltransferase family A protein [Dysgonomonas sp. 216]NDW17628.1 glycosyltransferase family 2 protein [Dysgonomonas sp. 216]
MRYSFVICSYNREKYIGKTIESVCLLDFKADQFELLIVDNNSTDNTEAVCLKMIALYPAIDIRYIKETSQGVSYARNRGIKEAKGEFIIFVDDDETIASDYLTKFDGYLNAFPQIILAGTAVLPVYETEKPKWLSHFTLRLVTGYYDEGNEVKKLEAKNYPGTGHTIIKKELFERFGYYNTDLGRKGKGLMGAEDKDMMLRLIENNIDCYYLPGMPVYHHIPAEKLTEQFFNELTYSIGKSERIRTKNISEKSYRKRLFSEAVKWGASVILCIGYTITLNPSKGIKLLQFRKNVTKGLLGK